MESVKPVLFVHATSQVAFIYRMQPVTAKEIMIEKEIHLQVLKDVLLGK